jgi:small-conductance mechanosensitive channel
MVMKGIALHKLWHDATHLFAGTRAADWTRAGVIFVLGLVAARLASRGVARVARRGLDDGQVALVRRIVSYSVFGLALAWALNELGFSLGVLLGAAGVATVAIGFAAQSSLSNLISGLFLFGERPFGVGDVIEVEGVVGKVLAVDLIATKLATGDNHFVRIPNELMFKTKVVNYTRFPLRRFDLVLPVAYDQDLAELERILRDTAELNAHAMAEPAPVFFVTSFTNTHVEVQFSTWCLTASYPDLRASLTREIKRALEGRVRVPYPRNDLGGAGEIAVRVVGGDR